MKISTAVTASISSEEPLCFTEQLGSCFSAIPYVHHFRDPEHGPCTHDKTLTLFRSQGFHHCLLK